jgi:ATP-dependent RNA helicase SUPV3L1/SUV3
MLSLLGCSSEELGEVLKALGFRCERKLAPSKPATPAVASEPVPAADGDGASDATSEEKVAGGDTQDDAELTAANEEEQPVEAVAETELAIGEAVPVAGDAAASRAEQPAPVVAVETAAEEPAPLVAAEAAAQGADAEVAEPQAKAEAYIEVWRPRRRQHSERKHRSRGQAPQAVAGPERGQRSDEQRPRQGRGWRGERRKGEEQRRRDDRPRPEGRGSSGHGRKGGVDPDSPFAALSALKTELEKRAKEQGTT